MKAASCVHKSIEAFVTLFFPYRCCLCRSYTGNHAVCIKCWSNVVFIISPFCAVCSKPFFNPILNDYADTLICTECQEKTLYFKKCLSLGIYQDYLKNIIQLFKFHNQPYIGKFLGTKLASLINNNHEFLDADIIIPVPLQKMREKKRGYNQSLILAQALSRCVQIPISKNCLKRQGNRPPQSNLSMKERKLNVRGHFLVTNQKQITKKRILLIDDVFTTGSTLNECARVLRHAGATEILAITLARTA